MLAPIVLFVYNRPEHTCQTVEALKKNELADKTSLIIFSDAAKNNKQMKNVKKIRDYLKTINGFASIRIVEQEKNKGLANSIIKGVTEVINEYGKAIVVEDDIMTSPYFLRYMNLTLDKYENDKRIYSVSGFNFPESLLKIPNRYPYSVYFALRPSSWGWATWKDRWEQVDWEIKDYNFFKSSLYLQKFFNMGGKNATPLLTAQMNGDIDSWAARFSFNRMRLHGLSIYPVHSYVDNIGLDGSGVHCGTSTIYKNDLTLADYEPIYPNNISLNFNILEAFRLVDGKDVNIDNINQDDVVGGIKYHGYSLIRAIKHRIKNEIKRLNWV